MTCVGLPELDPSRVKVQSSVSPLKILSSRRTVARDKTALLVLSLNGLHNYSKDEFDSFKAVLVHSDNVNAVLPKVSSKLHPSFTFSTGGICLRGDVIDQELHTHFQNLLQIRSEQPLPSGFLGNFRAGTPDHNRDKFPIALLEKANSYFS